MFDRVFQRPGVVDHAHCRIVPGEHALAEAGIARQPRLDLGHRLPPPCQQALAQNGLIDGQQQHEQVWITPARSRQMAARAIDQHVLPRRQPAVDFPRDAIGQAIGMPAQGKRPLRLQLGKLLRTDPLRRLPTASAERVMTRRTRRQPRSANGARAASSRLSLPEPEGPMR